MIAKPVDYTDIDFDSLRVRLFALVAQVFPDWTDQAVADFGNVLVEEFAFVGDVLMYYVNNHGRESRIVTASQRRSLIGLTKLIGFAPTGATASSADVTLSIAAPTAADVVIPAGSIVKTATVTEPIEFQLVSDATIQAGTTSTAVSAENSADAVDSFTATGQPNQEYQLSQTPYLDDSALVVAANGVFAQVDNFLNSSSTDRHFSVVVDQNDRARLRFGNGVTGAVPSGTISVAYKTGGGSSGNVPAGAINVIEGSFTDNVGNAVTLSVTNIAKADGGFDRMTTAAIKLRAPAATRTPVNSIKREDFEINAMRLGGVGRALMLTSDEDPSVPENEGNLYIIPPGGGTPSPTLKAAVLNQVTNVYPPPLTWTTNVLDPVYRFVDIRAVVFLRAGFSRATAKTTILANLASWFSVLNDDESPNENVDFGANYIESDGSSAPAVPWSDVFNVVRDAAPVRKLSAAADGFLLNGVRADVALDYKEFPKLGNVVLVDGDTGETL